MGRINERMLSGMGATRGGRGVRVYVGSGGRSKTAEVLDDITNERAFDNRLGWKKLKRDRNQESAHQVSGNSTGILRDRKRRFLSKEGKRRRKKGKKKK